MKTNCLKYMIPIDFTDVSKSALNFGAELARQNDDALLLMHVVQDEKDINSAKSKLRELTFQLDPELQKRTEIKVFEGNIFEDIGKTALTSDSCLVILGTHGERGLQRIFGSHALRVIKKSKVPIIVVQESTRYQEIDKIAMTIDLEKESVQVARASAILGYKLNAEVILVGGDHSDPNLRRTVLLNAKLAKDYLEEKGVRTRVELLDRSDFEANLLNFCEENGVDMLAATYYPDTFYPLSDKFVQGLFENDLSMPVITVDSQEVGLASPISFFTAV